MRVPSCEVNSTAYSTKDLSELVCLDLDFVLLLC